MSSFNVMNTGRAQVLVDEQQLQQLQAEMKRRGEELERLKTALETLSSVNTPAHFLAAAMGLCNELASRWNAERVGIGFLKGRYVRLKALSHTERITRHMQLVQDIEAAMEECLDQDVEILFPPPKEASFVYRATETLSGKHGPSAIVSLPLRRVDPRAKEEQKERYGNVVAVLIMERKIDKPLNLQEVEALRLTCDLFTSRLNDLYENDRWIGAKLVKGTRKVLSWGLGAKNTWAKAAALGICGFIAFAILVHGTFRVEAPFVIEAVEKRIISTPYEGLLIKVNANVDDVVFCPETAAHFDALAEMSSFAPLIPLRRPPSVLAELDTLELDAQLAAAEAAAKEAGAKRLALDAEGKRAEADIQELEELTYKANAAALRVKISRSKVITSIDGVVFKGDLHNKIGATVKTGDVLYEVGQVAIRADLSVSEDQIADVWVGQPGNMRTTANPDTPIPFKVERVTPVATSHESKNVFHVRVVLDDPKVKLKEGNEGLAKLDVRQETYGWIWSHKLINWVRMKLWM